MAVVVVALALAAGVQAVDRRALLQNDTTPTAQTTVEVSYNETSCNAHCASYPDEPECQICIFCEENDDVSQCKDLFDTPIECGEGDDPAAVHCRVCTRDPYGPGCLWFGWLGYLSSDDFKTMSAAGGGDEEPTESASYVTNMQITMPEFCDDDYYTKEESIACHRSQLLAYCINATTDDCCSGNTVAFNGSCPTSDEIENYATKIQEFAQLYTMPAAWPYAVAQTTVEVSYNDSSCSASCDRDVYEPECQMCTWGGPQWEDLFNTPVECDEGDDPAAAHCRVCTRDPVADWCNIGWQGYLSSDDFKTYMSVGGREDVFEPEERTASYVTNMLITMPDFCDYVDSEEESIACHRSQLLAYCVNATTDECCSGNTVAFNGSCPTSDEIADYATRLQEFAQLYTMPYAWPDLYEV